MDMRAALLLALTLAVGTPLAGRGESKPSIRTVRAYAAQWQAELAAVVAEEHYEQTSVEWPRGRAMPRGPRRVATRRLLSDVLLVRAANTHTWLMFRDVLEVDGKAVRDRQSRFAALFARPDADLVASARRIADETARYNLGRLTRNINTPATTLVFLDDTMGASTKWKGPRPVRLNGAAAWEFTFEQMRAPFVLATPDGRPQPATGRISVDGATYRILLTELHVRSTTLSREGRPGTVRSVTKLTTRFGPVPGINPWVPLRMQERVEMAGGFDELLTGEAAYTKHRVFQTSVRVVGSEAR